MQVAHHQMEQQRTKTKKLNDSNFILTSLKTKFFFEDRQQQKRSMKTFNKLKKFKKKL